MWACSGDSPSRALPYEDGENSPGLALEIHPVFWRGPEILHYYCVHNFSRQGRSMAMRRSNIKGRQAM